MIKITNLIKTFGKNEVLKGIDLEISEGGVFAILGPNGSGKTTIIKTILGMVLPTSGSIEVNGEPVKNNYQYRKDIEYLPQIARFPENLKVSELIDMVQDIRGQKGNPNQLIDLFDLKLFLSTKLSNLSGGTRQKVNIVLCFMFDNDIIILDEPTVGLDPVALIRLKDWIKREKELGKTILITTHIMDVVEELSDEIVFLLEGKIYFRGTTSEMYNITGETRLERSIARILEANYEKNKQTA